MTNVDEEMGDETTALKANHEMNAGDVDAAARLKKDPMDVKFVNGNGKGDEVLIDVKMTKDEEGKSEEFIGLRKEELEKFAADPYWVRLRIVLLVLFGIVWVAMLVAAIAIIVVAPKCPPRPEQEWWETAVVYQLNPNSFLDTDKDGAGDIKGISEKLDYLKDSLGVSALNLGPMYPSPRKNFGYDITDFVSICGHYGKMEDFNSLRTSMHHQGMKLILDFIPNHTSRRHQWFLHSRNTSIPNNLYKDFYIWHSGSNDANGTRIPPNGWLNEYGRSAWTFDEARQEYYYHSYSEDEPDLNLTNKAVVKFLDDALLFWLRKKVDGFRFIGVEYLFEPSSLTGNNKEIQPKTYELVGHWRELLDNYSFSSELPKSRRFARPMIVDVDQNTTGTAPFFEYNGRRGAHLPTNKVLLSLNRACDTNCVYSLLKNWESAIESNRQIANWQVSNYNTSRVVTRLGDDRAYLNAINMLLLTLPGTTMIYNGDELGMRDVEFDANVTYSIPESSIQRAGQHSPMQWSNKPNAGFTTAKPWIPVADDYAEVNVEAQTAHGSGMSHIKVFKSLVALKNEPSFQWGKFNVTTDKSVLFYVRQAEGFDGYLVAINFGPKASTVNFMGSALKDLLPVKGEIVASTHNFNDLGRSENYKEKTKIDLDKVIYLKPTEGIVLKWEPKVSIL